MITAKHHSRATVTTSLLKTVVAIATGRISVAVTALHLFGQEIVTARAICRPAVSTSIVQPVHRSEIDSNFLTADGDYLITADGQVFYVMED